MSLPKTILDIIKVIHDKLEIAPEKDKIITISLWDFRDESEDTIPKMDLKKGLRKLAEDEKLFQLRDTRCLDKLGRTSGEKIEFGINRERFKTFYKKHLQEQKTPISKVEFLDEESVLNLAQKAEQIFESSEVNEKRQLLNFLLQNLKLQGKKLLFELKTPFDTVLQANKCSTLLPN